MIDGPSALPYKVEVMVPTKLFVHEGFKPLLWNLKT